jgi:hypothetical protein
VQRRDVLTGALAAVSVYSGGALAQSEKLIPWSDQPPPVPSPSGIKALVPWEALDSWITPNGISSVLPTMTYPPSTKRLGGLRWPARSASQQR